MTTKPPEDIVDRLQAIADLERGSVVPAWLYAPDTYSWAEGMSKLLNEAIAEIKRLRKEHR